MTAFGQDERDDSKKKSAGPLSDVAPVLREAIKLEFRAGGLSSKFPDVADAEGLSSAIMQASGGGGGRSVSGTNWQNSARGQKLTGVYGQGQLFGGRPQNQNLDQYLHLCERQSPFRQIHFEAAGKAICVIAIAPEEPSIIRLRQSETGNVLLQLVNAEGSATYQAHSFGELWFRHSKLLDENVFSSISAIGIGTPILNLHRQLSKHVVACLRYSDDARQKFLDEFKDLDAEDFNARESATARLGDSFETWSIAISQGIEDAALKPETRSRLKKVFETHASADDRAVFEIVRSLNLVKNPVSLVRILDELESADDIAVVQSQLQELTGSDLGGDREKWRAWAAAQQSTESEAEIAEFAGTRALNEESAFLKVRAPLSKFVVLTTQDKRVRLDRGIWTERFQGKTVPELARKLEEQIVLSNLPHAWFDIGGGYDIQTLDYPHVMFEEIVERFAEGSPYERMNRINRISSSQNQPKSLNREFDLQTCSGELEMHPPDNLGRNATPKVEYLKLNLRDNQPGAFQFSLHEHADGSFDLSVVDQPSDAVLLLTAKPNGQCRMDLVHGAAVISLSGETLDSLIEEYAEDFDQRIRPFFEHIGIDISPGLGGPLQFQPAKDLK